MSEKESFDFRKSEDQKRFDELPEQEKQSIINESHDEALLQNEVVDQISKLSSENLSSEDLEIVRSKVTDIFRDTDVVLHTTRAEFLKEILFEGLLSVELQKQKRGEANYSLGRDTQEVTSHRLISVTANAFGDYGSIFDGSGGAIKSQILSYGDGQRLDDLGFIPIHLTYNMNDIREKFDSITINDSSGDIAKTLQHPIKGLWRDEYLAIDAIEPRYLNGIAIPDKYLDMTLLEILEIIKLNYNAEKSAQGIPLVEDSPIIRDFERLIFAIEVEFGHDITVRDILVALGKKLKIPIYSINLKEKTNTVIFPVEEPKK